jgi:RNA polymerase sigma-19 factor, ECF subfamily
MRELNKTDKTRRDIGNFAERMNKQYKTELRLFLTRRLSRSRIDGDDVMQEAYVRLLRIKDAHLIENPRAYLYKIVSNIIHELETKDRRHCDVSEEDVDSGEMTSPTTGIDRIEHLSSLNMMLQELPQTQRQVLILLKYEGKTYKEISKELNLTTETVRRYAFLAVLHCRKHGWL